MFGKTEWITLGFTLVGVWLAYIAGNGVAAWGCGFAGIVILLVMLSGRQEEQQGTSIPTVKEIHETAEILARRRKAELDLETTQRENAVQDMLRKVWQLQAETKRTKGFSVCLTSVEAAPGEDPEIVGEAWRRFQMGLVKGPTNRGKWGEHWS